MAQDTGEASFVGRNHTICTLLDQLMEFEGKRFVYMLCFGFEVPEQCHTEEPSHPFSPTVAPITHNQQPSLPLSRGEGPWQRSWLTCSASRCLPGTAGHGILGDAQIIHND